MGGDLSAQRQEARNKAAEVNDDEETERHLIVEYGFLRFHWTPVIAAGHAHAPFERPIRNTTPLSSIESMKAEDAAAATAAEDTGQILSSTRTIESPQLTTEPYCHFESKVNSTP